MSPLRFSDNMIKLRRKKRITQEQLADFLGITKASVSKWETGQSLPDILLLPEIAGFFDVTIDELLGYEPQLSREQIRKLYHDFAVAFAEQPFETVMEQSREYVKKYYSCYPFLFNICVLWFNHFMLADSKERGMEILVSVSELCSHIIENCKEIGICEDTVILKASVDLQLGRTEEASLALEKMLNPCHLFRQSDPVLIQAYLSAGSKEKADNFAQISMFLQLLGFIAVATEYLNIHKEDFSICEETIRRILEIERIYELDHLHPNIMAVFYFQAAVLYCTYEKKQEALKMLKRFAANIKYLLKDGQMAIHGDAYFNRISYWYDMLELGADPPRNKKTVLDSLAQTLAHPAFSVLEGNAEYQHIREVFMKIGETMI